MNEKLNEALNEISDKYLEEAAKPKKKRGFYWLGAVAAILVVAILAGVFGYISRLPGNPGVRLLAAPIYPIMEKYPQGETGDYAAWRDSQKEQYDQPAGYADSLNRFFADSVQLFLQGEGNQAYSPVNVYMAMAMLAECAEGNSRQQILDLFGADSIEALRQQASYVWNAHYCDDGLTTLLMANSLWLDDAYTFRQATVDTLASEYYASSYHGALGTEEINERLRQWLNANTGDLLTEQSQNIKLDPETVMALASTIYFSTKWEDGFWDGNTKPAVFHNPNGDQTVWFMNSYFGGEQYFRADNFGAMSLDMYGNNKMWLILPDEGSTTDDLLESGDFVTMLQNPSAWNDKGLYDVYLSLPKFDVADQTDLVKGMQKLGITDVFDRNKANLSGLVADAAPYVGKIDHAVRVAVDEEGCIAAAYTVIQAPDSGMPMEYEDIYFTLDRPFIFVITSRDGLPLFAGTVAEP